MVGRSEQAREDSACLTYLEHLRIDMATEMERLYDLGSIMRYDMIGMQALMNGVDWCEAVIRRAGQ